MNPLQCDEFPNFIDTPCIWAITILTRTQTSGVTRCFIDFDRDVIYLYAEGEIGPKRTKINFPRHRLMWTSSNIIWSKFIKYKNSSNIFGEETSRNEHQNPYFPQIRSFHTAYIKNAEECISNSSLSSFILRIYSKYLVGYYTLQYIHLSLRLSTPTDAAPDEWILYLHLLLKWFDQIAFWCKSVNISYHFT